jgi:hypothetical protein
LSKNKSNGRIDGLVALTMAMGVAPLGRVIDIEALIASLAIAFATSALAVFGALIA